MYFVFSSFTIICLGEDLFILLRVHRTSWTHNFFFIILENSQPLFLEMLLWSHFFSPFPLGFQKCAWSFCYFLCSFTSFKNIFQLFVLCFNLCFFLFTSSSLLSLSSAVYQLFSTDPLRSLFGYCIFSILEFLLNYFSIWYIL